MRSHIQIVVVWYFLPLTQVSSSSHNGCMHDIEYNSAFLYYDNSPDTGILLLIQCIIMYVVTGDQNCIQCHQLKNQ